MESKFIRWLSQEMQARDWSIRELGRQSGVSHSQIAKVLRGEQSLTWDFCASMAQALNEPVWRVFILGGLIRDIPEEINENEQIRTLIKAFSQLSKEDQKDVLKYIKWVEIRSQI